MARWKRFRTTACLIGALAMPAVALAQTPPDPPPDPQASATPTPPPASPLAHLRFGLTFEGFYEYNANQPHDRINLLRAYDTRANTFGIQQAAAVVEFAPDVAAGRRFGGRLDLQFGQATDTVQGNPANEPRPDVYRNLWQAYGTYVFDVGRGLQMDFGKFASMLGFETNYAKDDNHFSRAYLFDFLPFYHSGFRVTLPVNDRVSVMYMLTNGVQQTEEFNNFKSNHVAAIVKPIDAITWTVNYYFGQEQPDNALPNGPNGFFKVFDTYATYALTGALSLSIDVNYTTNAVTPVGPSRSLQGLAVYGRYQVTPRWGAAGRYERLDDEGLFGGIAQVLQEATATAELKLADGFLMRGEFRRDWSNQPFFTTAAPGELRPHQNTALLGLVWWFGNKTGAW